MPTRATNTTPNCHLSQWEENDRILREDFNAHNAAIDAALFAAKSEAVENLQALAETVASAIGSGGATARIVQGSCVGTGGWGSSSPNSVTLDFKPLLMFLISESASIYHVMIRPFTKSTPITTGNAIIQWGDLTVAWYNTCSDSSGEVYQCNSAGATCCYTVIGVSA